jgi:predicted ArsR family transcriptional regulator
MTNQTGIGLARNTDPMTSHKAAHFVTRSGIRKSQKDLVLDFVRHNPLLTSKEIAKGLDLCPFAVARRLPDLESDGLVVKAGYRTVINGRDCTIWRAN